jgi:hypothetical protein
MTNSANPQPFERTNMPFDMTTRTVLEYYTAHPPATEDLWYGPWTTILTTLFPSTQGYIVTPQRRLPDDIESHFPDFIIEVVKLSTPPLTFRTVLIVEIKNSQHWQSGIRALERRLGRQTDAAFAGTAHTKVYWIGTIGPHWRYGEKDDDGQDLQPLIDWHHTTHDQACSMTFKYLLVSLELCSQFFNAVFIIVRPLLRLTCLHLPFYPRSREVFFISQIVGKRSQCLVTRSLTKSALFK